MPAFLSGLQMQANNKQAAGLLQRAFPRDSGGWRRGLVISPDCERHHKITYKLHVISSYANEAKCKEQQQQRFILQGRKMHYAHLRVNTKSQVRA